MMRQGEAGNSSEMLTSEQEKRIDEHFEAELARLRSDFPYAELFTTTPPTSALKGPTGAGALAS
jgi:hypothetical protein